MNTCSIFSLRTEMSELYEVRLDFKNDNALRSSSQKLAKLPFCVNRFQKFKKFFFFFFFFFFKDSISCHKIYLPEVK